MQGEEREGERGHGTEESGFDWSGEESDFLVKSYKEIVKLPDVSKHTYHFIYSDACTSYWLHNKKESHKSLCFS